VVKPTSRAPNDRERAFTGFSRGEHGNIQLPLGVVGLTAVSHFEATHPPGAASSMSAARIVDNAFRVLGLTPRASWPEVARAADALIAALEAGDPTAASYATPLGPQPRTTGAVRVARARLRDPDERIQQEIWWEAPARGPWLAVSRDGGPDALAWSDALARAPQVDPWPHAPAAWGWRSR
jgi:hypothetical protein